MNQRLGAAATDSRRTDGGAADRPRARSRDNLLLSDDFGEENCCPGRCLGYVTHTLSAVWPGLDIRLADKLVVKNVG